MTSSSAASQSGSEWIRVPSRSKSTACKVTYRDATRKTSSQACDLNHGTSAEPTPAARRPSGVKVIRLGMSRDDRVGGLLGDQLELLGQGHADAFGLEDLDDLGAVLKVRAGRVTEGVAAGAVADLEHPVEFRGVLAAEPELGPDPGVPVLREGLGELDGQAVQLEVVPVGVLLEQRGRGLADLGTDGDELQGDHVDLAGLARPEEVGQAQVPVAALAREGEPDPVGAV